MRLTILLFAIILVGFVGCSSEETDSENPTVEITSPVDGGGVTPPVTIIATASDNEGIAEVTLYVDSVELGSDGIAPFHFSWDVSGLEDLSGHVLYAIAEDASGNTATSDMVNTWINLTGWNFLLVETEHTASSVSLVWPSSPTALGSFRLHYDSLPGVDTTDMVGMSVGLIDTSATITGLLPESNYYFRAFLLIGDNLISSNEIPVTTDDAGAIEWITVAGGGFSRGALDGSSGLEGATPVRWITVTGFQMSKNEITCAQYRLFIDAGGYDDSTYWSADGWDEKVGEDWTAPERWNEGSSGWLIGDDYPDNPVAGISYYEAEAYSNWISGRLPTEAEWEYAARGGSGDDTNGDSYPDGNTYPWGIIFSADIGGELVHCNFNNAYSDPMPDSLVDDYDDSAPVGSFPSGASWCGIEDMTGNVAEWVSDWFSLDYYATSGDIDPQGPTDGDEKVVRGGSFISQSTNGDPGYNLRTWRRDTRDADDRKKHIGFRVVKDL